MNWFTKPMHGNVRSIGATPINSARNLQNKFNRQARADRGSNLHIDHDFGQKRKP